MAIPFLSNIDLSQNEIQNAVWHKLNAVPSKPKEGQYYYDTTNKRLKYYNGTAWVTVGEYADKLTTARTITFGGNVTGSVSFDGSKNVTANITVKQDSHTHTAATIAESTTFSSAGYIPTLYNALVDTSRANRFAFTPAAAVKIEYSKDGGTTWTDYGATANQKLELFAMTRAFNCAIGGNIVDNEDVTTQMQTRVTISPTDRYASLNHIYVWMSSSGHTCKMDIERSTIGAKETFTKIRNDVPISGWSGPNVIDIPGGTYGGGSNQNSNYYSYRFTFKVTAVTNLYPKLKPYILDIRGYGQNCWGVANQMMFKDHMYGWDSTQSVYFPNAVRAKNFIVTGTNTSNYTRFWSSDAANNMYASINGKIPLVIMDGVVKSANALAGTIDLGTETVKWNNVYANTYHGALSGNASTATKLATARNLKIGNTAKKFDGSADVTWTWEEMGVPRVKALTNTGADFTDFVIPLCSLDNSVISADLYFCGTIYLKRANILNQMTKIDCMCGKYYNSTDPRYIIEVSGSTSPISAVTFAYNSKKYFGIKATLPSSAYDGFSRVVGFAQNWSFINAIQVYNNNTKTIINAEIYNSLVTMSTKNASPHQFYGDVYADNFKGISTKAQSLFYGVTAGNATTQTATIDGVKEYYNGLTVVLRMGYQTNTSTTLNINGLGAVPIYYGTTSRGGYYYAGYTYTFVYDTSKATPGFVGICSYNSDSTGRYIGPAGNIKALNAIVGGNIICGTKSGYSNLKSGAGFDISYPILYAGSSLAAGATSINNWTQHSFGIGTTQSLTMVSYQAVYIKGNLDGSIFTPASTAPLTQSIPTTEDGYDYIYLGYAYTAANLQLMPEHPIFRFSNGKFRPRAEAVSGSAPIETVTSLPAINNETRNKLYRYNGHIYYVDKVSSGVESAITVGTDLSGKILKLSFPDDYYNSIYTGLGNHTIVTGTGNSIMAYKGSGSNNSMCNIAVTANNALTAASDDIFYSVDFSGPIIYENKTSQALPDDFGKVTAIISDSTEIMNFFGNKNPMNYMKAVGTVEKWVKLENEVAVINNLTSTSTIDALSANMGRELNEKFINNTLTTVSNCNDTTLKTGFYYLTGSATNVPFSSAWFLQVMKQSDTNITQILYRYRDNEIYERHYNTIEGTSWKDWKPVLSDTGWKDLSLATNWKRHSNDYNKAQYRKINNIVYLRGTIRNDTDSSATIGTLPAGYRPKVSNILVVSVSDTFKNVYINSSGSLGLSGYVKGQWVSIDGTSFFID